MFKKQFNERLREWRKFRESLEFSHNPIQKTIDFYKEAAIVRINVDPYTQELWPDPWELLNENVYCDFSILLGICYTLQLTERFSQSHFEIHITHDKEKSQAKYLLLVDGYIIDSNGIISDNDLSETLSIESRFVMPSLQ